MAVSTEATVRSVIAEAIRGIAADLGFDDIRGNIREYPIEMHHDDRHAVYLKSVVNGRQEARAIAVDVRGHDEPFAMRQIARRTYSIRVIFYYAKGTNGEAYQDMIDHARLVRGEINELSPTLSGTVTRILSATPLDITEQDRKDHGKILVGTLAYSAERTNPDF